ncbi:MAG: cyclase family protein [Steroidobacteraceae bacterium]
MRATVRVGGEDWDVDFDRAQSLAIEVSFSGTEPRHFGAPRASAQPLTAPGVPGRVADGASCNCMTWTLTPHCNGTHTECAGHLTVEPMDAFRIAPTGLLPAALLTVTPQDARHTRETSDPAPRAGDSLVTRRRLMEAWATGLTAAAAGSESSIRALVIRTLPNPLEKRSRDYTGTVAPYLSREAGEWLVERGIGHLVVDLPSIDRIEDEGRLTAHRVFFGLPPRSTELARARRSRCTLTELAYVPDCAADGEYLLELQVPALAGDAVPSRPLLYAVRETARASGSP